MQWFAEAGPADETARTGDAAPDAGEQEDFAALIRGRYKADFDARVQKILDGRLRGLRQENARLRQEREQRQEQARQALEAMAAQEEQVRQVYPEFRWQREMENPAVGRLVCAGVEPMAAYEVVHREDILRRAMAYSAKRTARQAARSIASVGRRPAENGGRCVGVTGSDPRGLTSRELADIRRRVMEGEKISFYGSGHGMEPQEEHNEAEGKRNMEKLFDLQVFAQENTQTTGGLSAEMKTYYGMELLDNAKPQLVHNQFAATKPLPTGGGKTVEWRKFGSFDKALTPLTEGVTPDGSGISVSYITKELRPVRRLHHGIGYAGSDGHRRRGAGDHRPPWGQHGPDAGHCDPQRDPPGQAGAVCSGHRRRRQQDGGHCPWRSDGGVPPARPARWWPRPLPS